MGNQRNHFRMQMAYNDPRDYMQMSKRFNTRNTKNLNQEFTDKGDLISTNLRKSKIKTNGKSAKYGNMANKKGVA